MQIQNVIPLLHFYWIFWPIKKRFRYTFSLSTCNENANETFLILCNRVITKSQSEYCIRMIRERIENDNYFIERVLINDNFKTVFWILLTCLLVSSEKDKLTIVAIMNCSLTLKAKHLTILRKLVSFERRYNSERKKEKFLM